VKAADRAFDNDLRAMLAILKKAKDKSLREKASPDYDYIRSMAQQYFDREAWEQWRREFQPMITKLVIRRGEEMAKDLAEFGFRFDVQNLQARDWFNKYTLRFAQPICDTTNNDIRRLLAGVKRSGKTLSETQNYLTSMFRAYQGETLDPDEWAWYEERLPRHRTENIARTETLRAANAGSHEIHKMWGVGWKEWLATYDDRARPEHMTAGSEYKEGGSIGPIPIDQPFIVMGEELMYPHDPAGSPKNFCNCRCTTAPFFPKEVVGGEEVEPEPEPFRAPDPIDIVRAPQPGGKRVSEAISVEDSRFMQENYQRTLDIIDELHGTGEIELPQIPAYSVPKDVGWHGELGCDFFEVKGEQRLRPLNIKLSKGSDHPGLTSAHETGHFLDLSGIGKGEFMRYEDMFASRIYDYLDMKEVMETIRETEAYKTLFLQYRVPHRFETSMEIGGLTKTVYPSPEYAQYCLQSHELWARAYSQWVAMKSNDAVLLGELALVRSDKIYGNSVYWSDEDFAKIMDAIDNLFAKLGWTE